MLKKSQLHLIGLTSIFLSSKFEDSYNSIPLEYIVNNAGHNKFSRNLILKMEREMLQALSFNVHCFTMFEEAYIMWKSLCLKYLPADLYPNTQLMVHDLLLVISMVTLYSVELMTHSLEELTSAILYLGLQFMTRYFRSLNSNDDNSEIANKYPNITIEYTPELDSNFSALFASFQD